MALRNRRLDMGNKPVAGVADAVDPKDAVNKSQLDAAVGGVQDTIDGLSIPAMTQTDFISGYMPAALNGDYRLVVNLPYDVTITETTTRCASGTATATFKVNSTALGGTANSVSSSEQSQAHSSDNEAVAGDDIVLTISSASSCVGFSFTITFTRTLAAA